MLEVLFFVIIRYMILKLFVIFIGGGIGAIMRYIVTLLCRNIWSLPILGTLIVNLVGCFLIGYIFGIFVNKMDVISQTIKIFVTIGILGSLTTFSTFNFEIFELIKSEKYAFALLYFLISCLGGLLLTYVGYSLSLK